MIRRAGLLIGAAMLFAACAAPTPAEDVPAEESAAAEAPEVAGEVKTEMDILDRVEDSCGLDAFKPYLGKNASEIPADMLPEKSRILGPFSAATMDYVPTRVNILTDADGMIIGMKCG